MSNLFHDPTIRENVVAMHDQLEAICLQFESPAKALNDSAARIAASMEALNANIDSSFGIPLEEVRQSLASSCNIDSGAVTASLSAAYGVDLQAAIEASSGVGLDVGLEATRESLAAAQSVNFEAMRASLARTCGVDLEAVKEILATSCSIDFDDLAWLGEPPDVPDDDADQFDGRAAAAANTSPDTREHVGGGAPAIAVLNRLWQTLQALAFIDNLLGDPGMTTLREAVSVAANEVLLFVWLVSIAQAPSPPPAPRGTPVPDAQTMHSQVTQGPSMDSDGLLECRPLTADTRLGTTDPHQESDREGMRR